MRDKLIDALWLFILGIYVIAGIGIVTFHGDEAMQVYMSNDYATAFIYREPQRLMTSPPYDIDSEPQLRLINGSISRYAIGLSWHLAGFTNGDLPPRPGWDWGLDYDTNVATDHLPSDRLMLVSRISSALFLAFSVPVMFSLGWHFGGRPLAYLTSLLYTIHPVILLNGRRAMMEGSMLFFGLLTILIALVISRKREQGAGGLWGWWLGLILAGGLAVVSKHTSIIFVASAFGWIGISELLRWWTQRGSLLPLVITAAKAIVSLALIFAIFIALSPALWNDPITRLQDLIEARSILLGIQIAEAPLAGLNRVLFIIFQPFMSPLAHYELLPWSQYSQITAQIEAYMASPLSGLQFGTVLGSILTLLMLAGVIIVAVPRFRPRYVTVGQASGLLMWLLVTCVALLANPLPWQRYYLPLMPIAVLLVGITIIRVAQVMTNVRVGREESPIVTSNVPAQTNEYF